MRKNRNRIVRMLAYQALGLSLIELMMALVLSVMLLPVVWSLSIQTENNIMKQMDLLSIQHTLETVSLMMTRELHEKGVSIASHYFLANTHRTTANGQPIYALHYRLPNNKMIEIAEGLTHFQIIYDLISQGEVVHATHLETVNAKEVIGLTIQYAVCGIESHCSFIQKGETYVAIPKI